VCTIGPTSEEKEPLRAFVQAGMNVARLNFSHGSPEEHLRRIKTIREVEQEMGTKVAILLDTKGPEIRTGILKEGQVQLEAGKKITLTTEEIEGDASRVSVSYKGLHQVGRPGSTILVDDGLISLKVKEIQGTEVHCRIENGGELKHKKGVNLPGISVNLPGITEKDAADI